MISCVMVTPGLSSEPCKPANRQYRKTSRQKPAWHRNVAHAAGELAIDRLAVLETKPREHPRPLGRNRLADSPVSCLDRVWKRKRVAKPRPDQAAGIKHH